MDCIRIPWRHSGLQEDEVLYMAIDSIVPDLERIYGIEQSYHCPYCACS